MFKQQIIDRFISHVINPGDWNMKKCFIWNAYKDKDGYGCFRVDSKTQIKSHRFAYEVYYNEKPGNKLVCHLCDNPSCVNPSHLFLGTVKDNATDMVNKQRSTACQKHPNTILTNDIILNMIEDVKQNKYNNISEIAEKLDLVPLNIHRIFKMESWKSLTMQYYSQDELFILQKKLCNRGSSRLNRSDVIQIKQLLLLRKNHEYIASIYNVDRKTIYNIKTKRTWKHVQI